jgi:hypothetical protein
MGNAYDRLLRYDVNDPSKLVPDLAKSWKVSPTARPTASNCKPGPEVRQRQPADAEDVVYSLQRAVLLDKTPAFILTQFGFTKDNVKDKVRADRPADADAETDKAYAPTFVLNCLTANVAAMVDKKLLLAKEVQRRHGLRLAEDQLRRLRADEDPRMARQRGGGAGAQRQLLGRQVQAHGARDLPPHQGKPPRSACCWKRATPTSRAT